MQRERNYVNVLRTSTLSIKQKLPPKTFAWVIQCGTYFTLSSKYSQVSILQAHAQVHFLALVWLGGTMWPVPVSKLWTEFQVPVPGWNIKLLMLDPPDLSFLWHNHWCEIVASLVTTSPWETTISRVPPLSIHPQRTWGRITHLLFYTSKIWGLPVAISSPPLSWWIINNI